MVIAETNFIRLQQKKTKNKTKQNSLHRFSRHAYKGSQPDPGTSARETLSGLFFPLNSTLFYRFLICKPAQKIPGLRGFLWGD
jgi:hypothetical protein